MKRRYKIILNADIDNPDNPFPSGGDYAHLTMVQGVVHQLLCASWLEKRIVAITLDKVVDKGVVIGAKAVSERHDELTSIQVTPEIKVSLHQSELFGPRYQFNMLLDKRHNFAFTVEQIRRLSQALDQLLAKVENDGS